MKLDDDDTMKLVQGMLREQQRMAQAEDVYKNSERIQYLFDNNYIFYVGVTTAMH